MWNAEAEDRVREDRNSIQGEAGHQNAGNDPYPDIRLLGVDIITGANHLRKGVALIWRKRSAVKK